MNKNLVYLFLLILVSTASWYLLSRDSKSSIEKEIRTFAIPDTARIGAVFIAERTGQTAQLKREEDGSWTINDRYSVRSDKVDMLLKTFNRVRIKRPVARTMLPKVMKDLSTTGVKVEVYDLNRKHIQTYYVGGADKNTSGTYMMIEGSSKPFVTHIRGWTGYLSTRFFTDEDEWRDRALCRLSKSEIKELILEYREQPLAGFRIENNGEEKRIKALVGEERSEYSTQKVESYLEQFNPLIAEGFENNQALKDSVTQECKPLIYLRLTDRNNMNTNIMFYAKNEFEKDGSITEVIDNDRNFFFVQETGDFGVVQQYATTGSLFKTLNWFSSE